MEQEKLPKKTVLATLASVMMYPFLIGMWVGHSLDNNTLQILTVVIILSPAIAAYVLPWIKKMIRREKDEQE